MLLALNAFLAAFAGAWSCTPVVPHGTHAHATRWTIAAEPSSAWTRVHFGAGAEGGTAFVGFSAFDHLWHYEDFHSDGSRSSGTSPGPVHGVWTWTGTYTTAQHELHFAVRWHRDGARLRRDFGRTIGTSFRAMAHDVCDPVAPG